MHLPNEDIALNDKNKDSQNCIIRGDCLKAMEKMLPDYAEKIKMAFIEPPLKDEFLLESRKEKRTIGNWLSLIKPRVKIARELLKNDGLIFITADEDEIAHLKILMNYLYGEKNFICNLIWRTNPYGNQNAPFVRKTHQYILCYAKNIKFAKHWIFAYPDEKKDKFNLEDEKGPYYWKVHCYSRRGNKIINYNGKDYYVKDPPFSQEKMIKLLEEGEAYLKKVDSDLDEYVYMVKHRLTNGTRIASILDIEENAFRKSGEKEIRLLFDGFMPVKRVQPTSLVSYFIESLVDSDEIVIDFFAGTGTTGHATWKCNAKDGKNRKFVLVQTEEELSLDSLTEKYFDANGIKKNFFYLMKERLLRAAEDLKKVTFKTILKKIDLSFKSYFIE